MARVLNRFLPLLVLVTALAVLGVAVAWLLRADGLSGADVPVRVHVEDGSDADGRLLLAGGRPSEVRARLDFELPNRDAGRWLLWLPRDPVDAVEVEGTDAAGARWVQVLPGFFEVASSDGFALAGYVAVLPEGLVGPQTLRLRMGGSIRSAPAPRILALDRALRSTASEMMFVSAIYAAWTTLLIAALALYWAIRDQLCLLYAQYALIALLFMATVDGQVYQMPGLGWFRELGTSGFWAVMLAFNAIALATLLRFAEVHASTSRWVRATVRLVPLMVAMVPLALLAGYLPALQPLLQPVATLAWTAAMLAGLLATTDGARREVSMAAAVGVALLVLLLAAMAHEAMHRAWLEDGFLTRHGYQFALVLMSVILFVGLCSRVGKVRQRLDDETVARRDSEQRLRHEQVRGGFVEALQEGLRDAEEDRIAQIAYRILGIHAGQMLGTEEVLVVGEQAHEQERLFVQATTRATATARAVQASRALVRNHARNRNPVEVLLAGGRRDAPAEDASYLVVPMRTPAPGWAALVAPLARSMQPYELAPIAEMARITVLHVEEALAACHLRRTAERDALTGSLNRRTLDLVTARSFRNNEAGESLSVLFIDIDHFKRVNDTHGHACGDECLRAVAAALRTCLRPDDVFGRYGGEEFLVLLPGQDAAAARVVAERLREAVEGREVPWQGQALRLTVSIGLASRRDGDTEPLGLLERADKALYRAKNEGRNRVCAAPAWVE